MLDMLLQDNESELQVTPASDPEDYAWPLCGPYLLYENLKFDHLCVSSLHWGILHDLHNGVWHAHKGSNFTVLT